MRAIISVVLLILVFPPGAAADTELKGQPRHETVLLSELLDVVSRASNKQFLVYQRIPAQVVIGPARMRDVSYPMLLALLRNNDLAAVTMEGVVNIVPVSMARTYPFPLIEKDDGSLPDDEWVARIVRADNAHLRQLVPLVRPLVPQAGHLTADPVSNTMIVIAPYGVTRQVAFLVATLDRHTPKQQARGDQSP